MVEAEAVDMVVVLGEVAEVVLEEATEVEAVKVVELDTEAEKLVGMVEVEEAEQAVVEEVAEHMVEGTVVDKVVVLEEDMEVEVPVDMEVVEAVEVVAVEEEVLVKEELTVVVTEQEVELGREVVVVLELVGMEVEEVVVVVPEGEEEVVEVMLQLLDMVTVGELVVEKAAVAMYHEEISLWSVRAIE